MADEDPDDGSDGTATTDRPGEAAEGTAAGDDQPTVRIGDEGLATDEGGAADDGPASDRARTTAGVENAVPEPTAGFDWRGWLLVAVVVVAFLVVPLLIAVRPVRVGGFVTTYLVLPLVPAVILGATAVWVAVRGRQE